MATRVTKGMTFRATIADGNPKWKVVENRGRGMWIAKVVDDEDYSGSTRAFTSGEILSAANYDASLTSMMDNEDQWWASRPLGSIVHYNNGFQNYVRGVIVMVGGEKQMKAKALVGKWSDHDMPRRQSDGSIYYPYNARQVVEGGTFRPNTSCVYEALQERCQLMKNRLDIDPRRLKPVDLTVPDMDADAVEVAKLERFRSKLTEALGNRDVRHALNDVRRLLAAE